jgi:hypothetical protein
MSVSVSFMFYTYGYFDAKIYANCVLLLCALIRSSYEI